ncbi:hypothetical protein [Desulfurococcus amylolyticus]|uniref:Uncharacterized protein n=1 Tax=Desulfurococcus amylolyticus DSM 16532 TaxID=768672 RepID=I3XQF5_DESAM|nr:hypothetical protein [Desulfurococcus amylolyticus]AFL66179.1 hypothetical protein Desfe_0268 [Desulfurococcus amylolyticus DSM 16532]
MASSGFEKVIIRPLSREEAYALLYDVATLISNMKSFTITARDPSTNEVSAVLSRRSILGVTRIPLKIRSEVKSDDIILMYFNSDAFKAQIEYRLVPVFYALHINLRAVCDGGNTVLCTSVLESFTKELEDVLRKPVKPMITPPKPAPKPAEVTPQRVETPPQEAVKPQTPQPPSPTLPPTPPKPTQPERTPVPQEKETIDITKLFDEVLIAMALINSDLVSTGELTVPWDINTLINKAREKKGVLSQYKIGILSVKDKNDTVDLVIFVNRNGEPMGFYGRIENLSVKGLADELVSLEKSLPAIEITYRLWGVKQLPMV